MREGAGEKERRMEADNCSRKGAGRVGRRLWSSELFSHVTHLSLSPSFPRGN